MQIRSLVVVAPSQNRYSAAMEQAIDLATAVDATVTVAILGSAGSDGKRVDIRARQKSLATDLLDRGVRINAEVVVLKPGVNALVRLAKACTADLLILDPALVQADAGADFVLMLMQQAPCPVLSAQEQPIRSHGKLFVAAPASCEDLDQIALNTHVVAVAKAISQARKARMHLFTVYDQAALLRHSKHYSLAEIPRYETLVAEVRGFAAQLGIPAVHHHLIVGACAHTLCAYANRCGYDLVVIASPLNARQRETLSYLMNHLQCSLLVVSANASDDRVANLRSPGLFDSLVSPA
ncbi:universal stress protein [Pseudomonas sp. LAM2023]|uniref:universal stress protein n=1 Tax=Pseudomonas sp. LAM2023 TaxID=2800477 RepID=UPI00190CEA3C|nr:universal stress protein [Pseudomonas sp. LAM2023]